MNLVPIGVYGIGMNRAIFKMGKHCLISTRNEEDQYEVEDYVRIGATNESEWKIPVREADFSEDYDGTTIVVGDFIRV